MYKYCYTCVLDSSYACVLILLLHMCPHTAICVRILLYSNIMQLYMCPHTAISRQYAYLSEGNGLLADKPHTLVA